MSQQTELLRRAVRLQDATPENRAFVASIRESVDGGGTLNLHLKNPGTNAANIDVVSLQFDTTFEADITVYDQLGGTVSGGSEVTPDSLYLDNGETPDESKAIANSNVTFTSQGTPHLAGVVPSGGKKASAVGGAARGSEPLVAPSREFVAEIENTTSSTTGNAAIRVIYIEE